jgi:hypothetical protein
MSLGIGKTVSSRALLLDVPARKVNKKEITNNSLKTPKIEVKN